MYGGESVSETSHSNLLANLFLKCSYKLKILLRCKFEITGDKAILLDTLQNGCDNSTDRVSWKREPAFFLS